MDLPPFFGRVLRERRKAADLTQEQLAEKVSYSLETIKKIEAGKLRPGKQLAERLADCLELALEERAVFLKAARAEPRPIGPALPSRPVERTVGEGGASALLATTKPPLAHGTLTFLFTDIEGSTQLWEQYPDVMPAALARHDALLRESIEAHGGVIFKTLGDGLCAAFAHAPDALATAVETQQTLQQEEWGRLNSLHVRMAVHTGSAKLHDSDYVGPPLNRVARLLAAGHGGQVLFSRTSQELVCDHLPPDVELADLGTHRLKDLTRPEQIFQLLVPGLPTTFPPLRTLAAHQHNLPFPPTPLIGREREVTRVCALLRQEEVRLVTLTGPGGIGKTRLALQVASELLDDFSDGVWLVNLAPLIDSALVVSTIAQTLGMEESGDLPLLVRLQAYLRARQVLLLLDNFEHLLAAAPSVADILATCPRLKVLATSREVLHLRGEQEAVVPALALPDPTHLPPLERLTQYAAIQLFIARAQAAQADFALTDATAPAIAEICVRLDGLPLAIELAAVRIKLLPPHALVVQLDNRLKLLTRGPQDAPLRQQTLRNTLAWSYGLLEAGEQTLFQRLGVFGGGCTLEAVEHICALPSEGALAVIDSVSALVDQSLLQRSDGRDGAPRFVMLETIREYALEQLAEVGELEQAYERHLAYYLERAETAESLLATTEQRVWLDRLEQDHDNLRAALAWAVDHDAARALRLGGALTDFWHFRGHLSEGRYWLERALTVAEKQAFDNTETSEPSSSAPPIAARVKALHGAATLAHSQEDDVRAEALYTASLPLAQAHGDRHRVALLLNDLGEMALNRGDTQRAMTLHLEALALARTLGDQRVIGQLLSGLGTASRTAGDLGAATLYLKDCLAIYQRLDDRRGIAWALHGLGLVEQSSGAYDHAIELFTEALALARIVGDQENMVWLLYNLGTLSLNEHDMTSATRHFYESVRLSHALGLRQGAALNLDGLASVRIQQRELAQAAWLLSVADVQWKRATSSYGGAAERAEHEQAIAVVYAELDAAEFAAAWQVGQTLTFHQAIAEALGEGTASSNPIQAQGHH